MTDFELLVLSRKARENAYVPYSKFKVGAALLTKEGKVYLGCNIENSSYSGTICAERTAFAEAVKKGERCFEAIAVVGNTELCFPCGICRQFMSEFCDGDFKIILSDNGKPKVFTLKELLPYSFDFSQE